MASKPPAAGVRFLGCVHILCGQDMGYVLVDATDDAFRLKMDQFESRQQGIEVPLSHIDDMIAGHEVRKGKRLQKGESCIQNWSFTAVDDYEETDGEPDS